MNKKNIIMTIVIIIVIGTIGIILFRKNNNNKTISNINTNSTSNTNSTTSTSKVSEENAEDKVISLEADESGNIIIDTTNIGSKATFYNYSIDGITIRLFAVKASDGTIRMAFNTCQVCNPSPKAYFIQNGKNFVCQNCKNSFATDNIGKEKGGCNPIPITTNERIDGENTITITKQFLECYKDNFEIN